MALSRKVIISLLAITLLSSCARVKVQVEQRALHNEFLLHVEDIKGKKFPIYVDEKNKTFTVLPARTTKSESRNLVFTWPELKQVKEDDSDYPSGQLQRDIVRKPFQKTSSDPWFEWPSTAQDNHRYTEAVKISRWFWGLSEYAHTKPVRYDQYAPFISDDSRMVWFQNLCVPELSTHEYWVNQSENKRYPLNSDINGFTKVLFRLATLGIFWDMGYTIDDERWGAYNSATAWGWLGKGTYVLVQNREDMQFKVKGINFDPTQTTRVVSDILKDAVNVELAASAPVYNKNGVPYQEEKDEFKKLLNCDIAALEQKLLAKENLYNKTADQAKKLIIKAETFQNTLDTIHAKHADTQQDIEKEIIKAFLEMANK